MGFLRQEYWSGLSFPSPGDLPNPGVKPTSPALAGRFLMAEPPGKPTGIFAPEQKMDLFYRLWQSFIVEFSFDYGCHTHFTDEETQAQRGCKTFLQLHCWPRTQHPMLCSWLSPPCHAIFRVETHSGACKACFGLVLPCFGYLGWKL